MAVLVIMFLSLAPVSKAAAGERRGADQPPSPSSGLNDTLSPYWQPEIQQWGDSIGALSDIYGFHPDFIAAVISHESGGAEQALNSLGAAGLMGLIPGELESERPISEALPAFIAHMRWGLDILSYVVQQSGGDLYTALAAYRGGWQHVDNLEWREYAAQVLDSYGRALVARQGLSPDSANRWTVAVEIRSGDVPAENLLVLGNRPIVGLRLFTEHVVYAFVDKSGHAYYVRGYAVPLGFSEFTTEEPDAELPDQLEAPLRARLGEKSARAASGNPRVLLACLSSLDRLRGQLTTRWYSPSACPAAGR
jgi:hypothetical protein